MYTLCTHDGKEIHFTGPGRVFDGMQPAITPYTRHRTTCKRKHDRNHHRCNSPSGCTIPLSPVASSDTAPIQTIGPRRSRKRGEAQKQRAPIQRLTVEKAIDLYLIDRSKRAKSAKDAPFKDRYMLRDGSKKQQALLNQRFSESQF
jgi:hypothetical protein